MKFCEHCQQSKPRIEFGRKGEALTSRCRECMRAYNKLYYEQNYTNKPDYYLSKNRLNKERQRRRLKSILLEAKSVPCGGCGGIFHPWVMEFDHRDASLKIANVGNLAGRGCTDERLRAEIAKCDVVCANCHSDADVQKAARRLNGRRREHYMIR